MNNIIKRLSHFLGVQVKTDGVEKIISALGGFISISLIYFVSCQITDFQGAAAILPSMGAATVLLFGVPHGPLSQPWALFVGNLLSASVGVSCYLLFDNVFISAGLAVGLSVGLMFVFRCVHPPGGATALAAVIGGPAIHDLGFYYVIAPTLINCCIIFVIALAFNNLFKWRPYPLSFMSFKSLASDSLHFSQLEVHHIQHALDELKNDSSELDHLNPETLKQLFIVSMDKLAIDQENNLDLEVGGFYSNAEKGFLWSVRQVTDILPHKNPSHHIVLFKTIEGQQKHRSDSCTAVEFSTWAKEKLQHKSLSDGF